MHRLPPAWMRFSAGATSAWAAMTAILLLAKAGVGTGGRSVPTGQHCLHVCEYRGMIARTWRGAVRAKDAPAYAAYVQKTGIEGYQRTPGNRGAWLLWRVEGDHAEFITVSFWESLRRLRPLPARTSRRQSSIRTTSSSLSS